MSKKINSLHDCIGMKFKAEIDGNHTSGTIVTASDGRVGLKTSHIKNIIVINDDKLDGLLKNGTTDGRVCKFVIMDEEFLKGTQMNISELRVGTIFKYKHFESRTIDEIRNGTVYYKRKSGKESTCHMSEIIEAPWNYVILAQTKLDKIANEGEVAQQINIGSMWHPLAGTAENIRETLYHTNNISVPSRTIIKKGNTRFRKLTREDL